MVTAMSKPSKSCDMAGAVSTEQSKNLGCMRWRGVAYIQEVVCALFAVGWQRTTADGLSHLLSPEHAADAKHHL